MSAVAEPTLAPKETAATRDGALVAGALLLLSVFLVARPIANQMTFYSGDSAFAALAAALMAALTGWAVLRDKATVCLPERLTVALIVWIGLHAVGLVRAPYFATALGAASDAVLYAAMLASGFFLARREPQLIGLVARLLIAMVAVEAFTGVWQYFVDLPRMWQMRLPHEFEGSSARARFYGNNVFGTFVNPNALGAYLLIGIWLVIGLLWNGRCAQKDADNSSAFIGVHQRFQPVRLCIGILLVALMLAALYLSDSKGAAVAGLAGGWYFFLQRLSLRHARAASLLKIATGLAVLLMVILLGLALVGVLGAQPFGASMQVRLEYWKAGLGMIADRPVSGVGLAGFTEHYSFFKAPLAGEVKEAHNDYLQLWAELGIAGLLGYLALWWLLLRARPGEVTDVTPVAPVRPAYERLAIAGGVLAFACMYVAFAPFNVADVLALLRNESVGREQLASALQTLALPLLFACMVVMLRPRAGAITPGLRHGIKAAIVAVLVHQVVDYDFRAQAVMSAAFLLGGMLFALESRDSTGTRPTPLERASRYLLPLLALALVPGAVWIALSSGLPRAAAESAEREAVDAQTDPSEVPQIRCDAVAFRRQAIATAPFDSDAWLALAAAYERLPDADCNAEVRERILRCLQQAVRLRPLFHVPKVLLAGAHMRRRAFDAAAAEYQRALERYPLHPPLHLWRGDALLLAGNVAEAGAEYRRALEIDARIFDINVRLSSAFSDPRAGAFARHGRQLAIARKLNEMLLRKEYVGDHGLWLRHAVSVAQLLRDAERLPAGESRAMRRGGAVELLNTMDKLVETCPDATQQAHAAFLRAMAFEAVDLARRPELALSALVAWHEARRLRGEALAQGGSVSPAILFDGLARYYEPRVWTRHACWLWLAHSSQ